MKNNVLRQFLCVAIFISLIVVSNLNYADETLSKGIVPGAMINHNGTAYFVDFKNNGLWKSDGTAAGTVLIKEDLRPKAIHTTTNRIFFREENKVGLWVSDGTTDGTIMVNSTVNISDEEMIGVGDKLLFTVDNGDSTYDLWVSNGTASGTKQLQTAIRRSTTESDNQLYNGKLYFQAKNSNDSTYELWVSDGTAVGTIQLKNALLSTDRPRYLTAFDGKVYFSMLGGLWVTDGTVAGTTEVKADAKPSYMEVFNSKLYFSGYTTETGTTLHLMSSDGTGAGTEIVKSDIVARELTVVGDILYFVRRDIVNSKYQLWKSDGTADGTVQVKDDIEPKIMKNYNNRLFFLIYNDDYKYDLWTSDGTEVGTELLWQYVDSDKLMAMSGNGVVFLARKTKDGEDSDVGLVWTSGTSATTSLLSKGGSLAFDMVELDSDLLVSESVVETDSLVNSLRAASSDYSILDRRERYNLTVENGDGGGEVFCLYYH